MHGYSTSGVHGGGLAVHGNILVDDDDNELEEDENNDRNPNINNNAGH